MQNFIRMFIAKNVNVYHDKDTVITEVDTFTSANNHDKIESNIQTLIISEESSFSHKELG